MALVPAPTVLLSHYTTHRDANGDMVLMMPWPMRSVLGCAGLTVIAAVGASLVAFFTNAPGLYGFSVMTVVFAAIVIPLVIYQSSRAWVLNAGFIKPVRTLGRRYWHESQWLGATSVILKREIWPRERGSTDTVLVETDVTARASRVSVLGVYNWDGNESRLASGEKGSLARSGPTVPGALWPLGNVGPTSFESAVSEAVHEIIDLLLAELKVPLAFECVYAKNAPDAVD